MAQPKYSNDGSGASSTLHLPCLGARRPWAEDQQGADRHGAGGNVQWCVNPCQMDPIVCLVWVDIFPSPAQDDFVLNRQVLSMFVPCTSLIAAGEVRSAVHQIHHCVWTAINSCHEVCLNRLLADTGAMRTPLSGSVSSCEPSCSAHPLTSSSWLTSHNDLQTDVAVIQAVSSPAYNCCCGNLLVNAPFPQS